MNSQLNAKMTDRRVRSSLLSTFLKAGSNCRNVMTEMRHSKLVMQQQWKWGYRLSYDLKAEQPAVVGQQNEVDATIQLQTRAAGHWRGMMVQLIGVGLVCVYLMNQEVLYETVHAAVTAVTSTSNLFCRPIVFRIDVCNICLLFIKLITLTKMTSTSCSVYIGFWNHHVRRWNAVTNNVHIDMPSCQQSLKISRS